MKKILIILMMLANSSYAQEYSLDINIGSRHGDSGYISNDIYSSYNENNTGVGITRYGENFDLRAGYFKNSYNKSSVYAGIQPKLRLTPQFSAGILFAASSGYSNTPENTYFIVLPNVDLRWKEFGLNLGYVPDFGDGYTSVTTLQFKFYWDVKWIYIMINFQNQY